MDQDEKKHSFIELSKGSPYGLGVSNQQPEKMLFGDYLSISKNGIEFNKKDYPSFSEDDFARKFIEILENYFHIKFEKGKS